MFLAASSFSFSGQNLSREIPEPDRKGRRTTTETVKPSRTGEDEIRQQSLHRFSKHNSRNKGALMFSCLSRCNIGCWSLTPALFGHTIRCERSAFNFPFFYRAVASLGDFLSSSFCGLACQTDEAEQKPSSLNVKAEKRERDSRPII